MGGWRCACPAPRIVTCQTQHVQPQHITLHPTFSCSPAGDAPLEDSTLSQGWDRLLALQRRWAAAFPTLSATGLAAALMAALLSSLLVGRAAQAGQRAGRQAEQSEDGKAQLRARTAAGGEGGRWGGLKVGSGWVAGVQGLASTAPLQKCLARSDSTCKPDPCSRPPLAPHPTPTRRH